MAPSHAIEPGRQAFDRCNLKRLGLEPRVAHGGEGSIAFGRIADRTQLAGQCNFIDFAELPPGVSIGAHRHRLDEEEFYLVLRGSGTMEREGERFRVEAGDLVRNPPGGRHSLVNDGEGPLQIFVFEVAVRA